MMNKTKIKDNIVNLLENIIKRSEIIERQSGTRNLMEIDLAMDDVRLLYLELDLLRKVTEAECMKGNEAPTGIHDVKDVPEKREIPKQEPTPQQSEPVTKVEPMVEQERDKAIHPVAEKKEPDQSLPKETDLKKEIESSVEKKPAVEKPSTPVELPKEEKPSHTPKPTVQTSPKPVVEKVSHEKQILGDKFSGNGNSVHERLAKMKEDKSIGARMQFKPIENLKAAIGVNEKFLFVNELFNGDLQAYNDAVQKLNAYISIHEAFEFLNHLTTQYNWDGQRSADTIEKFANLVQRRYMAST
jgi:hypothetical protein